MHSPRARSAQGAQAPTAPRDALAGHRTRLQLLWGVGAPRGRARWAWPTARGLCLPHPSTPGTWRLIGTAQPSPGRSLVRECLWIRPGVLGAAGLQETCAVQDLLAGSPTPPRARRAPGRGLGARPQHSGCKGRPPLCPGPAARPRCVAPGCSVAQEPPRQLPRSFPHRCFASLCSLQFSHVRAAYGI